MQGNFGRWENLGVLLWIILCPHVPASLSGQCGSAFLHLLCWGPIVCKAFTSLLGTRLPVAGFLHMHILPQSTASELVLIDEADGLWSGIEDP